VTLPLMAFSLLINSALHIPSTRTSTRSRTLRR
jgi:hypothetical protein